jgi:hypothetical protein
MQRRKAKRVKDRNSEKASKRLHSPAELRNDASLRYCGYRPFEAVFSDTHDTEMRFVRYSGQDRVVLAEVNSMREIPDTFPMLSVRRLTA